MRVIYLIIAMLLLVSCSSGKMDEGGLANTNHGISLEQPQLDGPGNYHPDLYELQVTQSDDGLEAVVRINPDEAIGFAQFDLVYEPDGLNPTNVKVTGEDVLSLAPLSLRGRIPVSVASLKQGMNPVELRFSIEHAPFRQAADVNEIPEPEIYSVTMTDDGILITGGVIIPGDYNFDGLVSGLDLFPLATRFNYHVSSQNRCLDGNKDGKLNGLDMFQISANFGVHIEGFQIYRKPDGESAALPVNMELISYSAPLPDECIARFEFLDRDYDEGLFSYIATSSQSVEGAGEIESTPSEEVLFSSTPTDPIITSLLVDGDLVEDGEDVGPFAVGSSIELRVDGFDPDGGEVYFTWSGTGDTHVIPNHGKIVMLSNSTTRVLETVYVTITDDDGGQPQTWSFNYSFGTAPVIRWVKIDGVRQDNGVFLGGIDWQHPLYVEAFGYDPERGDLDWSWSATGSVSINQISDTKAYVSNLVRYETETVTITATDDNDGGQTEFSFSFYSGYKPIITSLKVSGIEIEDGEYGGRFYGNVQFPVTCQVENNYGGVSWEGTGNVSIEPDGKLEVQVSNWDIDCLEKVTVTASGGQDGPYASRCFYFDTEVWDVDQMSFSVVPHPDEPEDRIRLILSVSEMMLPTIGVTLDFDYDHSKLYAGDTRDFYDDDDDCHAHWDGPWGEDAVTLFFPELEPANFTLSGYETAIEGGHVFYVDFLVIDGHGTTTDFTFGPRELCRFANADGMSTRQATKTFPALNVLLP